MAVFRYKCENCGYANDQFIPGEHSDGKVVKCGRCGRGVSARQVRDKSASFKEKDGVTGVYKQKE